jgi:VWFA-related protein
LLRVVFVSTIIIATFIPSFAQAQERPLEKGNIEDLRGVTKVYVEGGLAEFWLVRLIVNSIRKEIPELTFVTFADDADVWFLLSEEQETDSYRVSTASPSEAARERFRISSKLQARIISLQVPGHPKLVKKISTNWKVITRGGGKHSTPGVAREFIAAYRKANSRVQNETTNRPPAATAPPPRLTGVQTPTGPEAQTSVSHVASGPEEIGEEDVIRVNTSLVTIHANVIGRDGKPAPSLRKEDFSVYEDGVKQDLAVFEPVDRPFTVVLLIDTSGSVGPRLNAIGKAASVLVNSLRPDDQLVILTFDSEIREVLKLATVRDLMGKGLTLWSRGNTRLYDAVDFVIGKYLRHLPGRKAVVLLTDGIDGIVSNGPDGGSYIATDESNLRKAEELDALIYAVQYNTWVDPINRVPAGMKEDELRKFWEERSTQYLKSLTEKTGGRLYRADTVGDLAPAFASVVEELSRQYSLGYYPHRPQQGERRLIKVRVNGPDLVVHARDSYVSKSPESRGVGPK